MSEVTWSESLRRGNVMTEIESHLGKEEVRLSWAPWDNCSAPAILDFPYTGFPPGVPEVIIATAILIYMYAILTTVCYAYLLPSLRTLCDAMSASSDVLGATVMAAVAATPELAITVVSTFWLDGDIGAGAIVGSSTFNCLVIPALCAICSKFDEGRKISIWPLTRDSLIFCVSLGCLFFCFEGDTIHWFEAILMVVVYILYVIGMMMDKHLRRKTLILYYWIKEQNSEDSPLRRLGGRRSYGSPYDFYSSCEEAGLEDELTSILVQKKTWYLKVCNWLFWPVKMVLKFTIPGKIPLLAILISIIWISTVTYVATWMIIIIGYRLNIPDSLMGLTVLGVGLGLPELLSSLNVAKRGKETMALCNALGANTFNILICLGLPWCLQLAISQHELIWINASSLTYSIGIILIMVLILYSSLATNKFVLDRKIGWFLLFLYSVFVVLATLIEMNVFTKVNLPICDIKDYYND